MTQPQRPLMWVFGANSGIARAVCLQLIDRYQFVLCARGGEKLQAVAADLGARGGKVAATVTADFNNAEQLSECFDQLGSLALRAELALVAHGTLPDNDECLENPSTLAECVDSNFTSAAQISAWCAAQFLEQGRGELLVISSVAGDRGRLKNFAYGAAKAGLDTFLEGLQLRCHGSNVNVLNIKPGLTDTPMTAGQEKGLLFSSAETVAKVIVKAIGKRRRCIYAPGYWRLVLAIVRCVPAAVLAKTGF